ncbi:MAG TPA: DUF2269 domain-containing protein [Stellaceae bacterium]|jgi:uncharacterized membrane protein|nr:DUF2269 domain-containing protein [Stellaceae bacterium]
MDLLYPLLVTAHIIGATVLFGTGSGIAFFMVMAHRTRDPAIVAHTAGTVVIADTVFTATAVILQPITGIGLAQLTGVPILSGWIGLCLILFAVTGAFWLPVVWMQIRMRDLARLAMRRGEMLPPAYFTLYRWWFAFGFPAFAAVLGIIWLMVTKPSL